jgi:hypothetical protein
VVQLIGIAPSGISVPALSAIFTAHRGKIGKLLIFRAWHGFCVVVEKPAERR